MNYRNISGHFFSLVCVMFICLCAVAHSQEKKMIKADDNFNSFNYKKALNNYLKLFKKGESPFYVSMRVADCYRLLNQAPKAEEWYKKIIAFPDVPPSVYYYLSNELQQQGKYQEGVCFLNQYYQLVYPRFPFIASNYAAYYNYLHRDSMRYQVSLLPFNSSYSEIAPFIHHDKLYFSSDRVAFGVISRRDTRNDRSFYDLYSTRLVGRDSCNDVSNADDGFNSVFHDGAVYLTPDGDMAFITRNQYDGDYKKAYLDVEVLKFDNKQRVISSEFLPFRSDGFSIAHAFLTSDCRKVYFASDMPGGFGGMDLYASDYIDGFWGIPVNLGASINTVGNECYPFIASNGVLFFTSDGHPGLGGFDLFYAAQQTDGFSIPFNLGVPVNSGNDDISLCLTDDMQRGYFSSNRLGGVGGDDVYLVDFNTPLLYTKIKGSVLTSDKEHNDDVMVTVLDADGVLFNELVTDSLGQFTCYVPQGDYTLVFRKRLMKSMQHSVKANAVWNNVVDVQVEMEGK